MTSAFLFALALSLPATAAPLFMGGYEHEVELELPPAPRGTVPELSLVADGGVHGGPLGDGWRLSGQSSIVRRGQSGGVPTFSGDDVFELDGLEVVGIDGLGIVKDPHPLAGSCEARLEQDDNRCVRFETGDNVWVVQRDGWTWTYGADLRGSVGVGPYATESVHESADSGCDMAGAWNGPGAALAATRWWLSSVQDPSGNRIEYDYEATCAGDGDFLLDGMWAPTHQLSAVRYNGGTVQVSLSYEERPDWQSEASSGRIRVSMDRLSSIQVWHATATGPVQGAHYSLTYTDETQEPCPGSSELPVEIPGMSLLHRIDRVETGGSAAGRRRMLRCMDYEDGLASFDLEGEVLLDSSAYIATTVDTSLDEDVGPGLWSDPFQVQAIEISGDPWPDLWMDGTWIWRNEEGDLLLDEALSEAVSVVLTEEVEEIVFDLDLDGRTKLLVVDDSGCIDGLCGSVYELSTYSDPTMGLKLVSTGIPLDEELARLARPADVDGDGWQDLVIVPDFASAGADRHRWIRNTGSYPWFDSLDLQDLVLPLDPDSGSSAWTELEDSFLGCESEPGEYDEDVNWHEYHSFPPDMVEGSPSGIFPTGFPAFADEIEYATSQARLSDINGDGVLDVAYSLPTCFDWTPTGEIAASFYGPKDDLPDAPPFSRIFLGDGRGGFHDSGLGAGDHWLTKPATVPADVDGGASYLAETWAVYEDHLVPMTEAWGAVDLDRSGRATVLHLSSLNGISTSEGNLHWGGRPWRGLAEDPIPMAPDALDAEWIQLPTPAFNELPLPQALSVLADWDGDGYPDLLRVRKPERRYDGELVEEEVVPMEFRLFRNQLATPRGRLRSIQMPYGGKIDLTWAVSTQTPGNDRVPFALDVIQSVKDASGDHQFEFQGATYAAEAFRGFRDVQVRHASGRREAWRFGLSLPLKGRPLVHTVQTEEGTVVEVDSPLDGSGTQPTLDASAPYFLPQRRSCRAEGVGGNTALDDCLSLLGHADTDLLGLALVAGWVVGDNLGQPAAYAAAWGGWGDEPIIVPAVDPASVPDELRDGILFSSSGGLLWPNLTAGSSWAPLAGPLPPEIPVPAEPPVPGGLNGDSRFLITDTYYNDTQRPVRVEHLRLAGDPSDDLILLLEWSPFEPTFMGARLQRQIRQDHEGRVLDGTEVLDWGAFDRPLTVHETGRDMAATRTWSMAWDRGELVQQTDPDGGTTNWDRNACGQPTRTEDAVHRVTWNSYNEACKPILVQSQGAWVLQSWDGLGRLSIRSVLPAVGTETMVEQRFYEDGLAGTDVRETWTQPQVGIRYGTDATAPVEHHFLDPWGRTSLVKRCEGGPPDSSGSNTVLAATGCIEGTDLRRAWAWAGDGSLRLASETYAPGEVAPTTATWRGPSGQTSVQMDPAPDALPASPAAARWTSTTWRRGPGLREVEDPLGVVCTSTASARSASMSCDGHFRASVGVDPLGRSETVGYPVARSTEEAEVRTTQTERDPFGRVERRFVDGAFVVLQDGVEVSVSDPGTSWSWTPGGRLLSQTDAAGTTTTWVRDLAGRPLQAEVRDGAGAPLTLEAWNYADSDGLSSPESTWTDGNGNPWTTVRDGFGRVRSELAPDESLTTYAYGPQGLERVSRDDGTATVYEHDAHGRVVARSEQGDVEDGVPGVEVTWSFDHDARGRPVWTMDPDGVETTWTYAWNGLPRWQERPSPVSPASTWTLQRWSWTDRGELSWHEQAGVSTGQTYDRLGRLQRQCQGATAFGVDTDCTRTVEWGWTEGDQVERQLVDGALETEYFYDPLGPLQSVVHPDASVEDWQHDILGRVGRHIDEDGVVSEWRYDGLGRVVQEQLPGLATPRTTTYALGLDAADFDASGLGVELHQVAEPDGGTWTFAYDFAGRAVWTGRPDGSGQRDQYDGRRLSERIHQDCRGGACEPLAAELWSWDALGRLQSVVGPDELDDLLAAGGPAPDSYMVEYGWTDAGRPAYVIGGGGEETWYDWEGGTLRREDAIGLTRREYAYDPDVPRVIGTLWTESSASVPSGVKRQSELGYDLLGRLAWAEDRRVEGATVLQTQRTEFSGRDSYGTPRSLTREVDGSPHSDLSRETDARGRLLSESLSVDGDAVGTGTYGWTPGGRVERLGFSWTGGGSSSVRYDRSAGDALVEQVVLEGSEELLAQVLERDPMGRVGALELVDGGSLDLSRDGLGRVTELLATTPAGLVQERSYAYDARGRLTDRWIDETRDRYQYQEPGWLTEETRDADGASPVSSFTAYDPAGNRTSQDGVAFEVDAVNRLLSVGGAPIAWDELGAITTDHRGTGFVRGADGRLDQLLDPGGTWLDIARDPLGRPVRLTESTGEVEDLFWGNPEGTWPLAGLGAEGEERQWVALEGMLIAFVQHGVAQPAVTDGRGDLVMLGEQLLGGADAFGTERDDDVAGTSARFVYAGLASLGDRPQMLAWNREVDPELGRFLSEDPLGLGGGFHRFAYAENRPTTLVDPEGLSAVDPSGFMAGSALAGAMGVWDPPPSGDEGGGSHGGKGLTRGILGGGSDPTIFYGTDEEETGGGSEDPDGDAAGEESTLEPGPPGQSSTWDADNSTMTITLDDEGGTWSGRTVQSVRAFFASLGGSGGGLGELDLSDILASASVEKEVEELVGNAMNTEVAKAGKAWTLGWWSSNFFYAGEAMEGFEFLARGPHRPPPLVRGSAPLKRWSESLYRLADANNPAVASISSKVELAVLIVVDAAVVLPGCEVTAAARVADDLGVVAINAVERTAAANARSASEGAEGLAARAGEIHGALDPIAANQRTTAVLRTTAGDFVGGGARDLSPAQRTVLGTGETAAKLPGAHAEVTVLNAAEQAGGVPQALGVSRPICAGCQTAIEASGGTLTSPTTAVWPVP